MIRVAIVGTGSISTAHLDAYTRFADRCRVVALVNNQTETAERLKEKYRLDCRIYQDYKDLLEGDQVDLVSICTPPFLHASMSVDLLRAGIDVLVEKPMALSLEECDRMLAAASESGSLLSVVGQNRFLDASVKLKRTIESGLLGKVVHAQVDSFWWRGSNYYDVWWRGTWETEGGGCTLNHGVHHADMLQWMIGMPQSVVAVIGNAAHPNSEVEDISMAILSYADGSLAQLTSSVVHHGEERQIVIQGLDARASLPWKVHASRQSEQGFPLPEGNPELKREIEQFAAGLAPLAYTGHEGQIDDVLSAIETGSRKVGVDGYEGRKVIELVTAIYEASFTRRQVELPLTKDSLFYSREQIMSHSPRFHHKSDKSATIDYK
ncbi:Gfo/Idh/MocA family protein [Cohnella cellulosilytica]|uniref:Gfo/Idh/MocA family protein n=1 Tax=Cohnella cellulosilytica TaxID=986710 RepID=A0ABW2FIV8_9BACL